MCAQQVVLKALYFVYLLIGHRAAGRLNELLLADWINRLSLAEVAGGVGVSVVLAAAGIAVIKRQVTL